jgi:hypothetical protein
MDEIKDRRGVFTSELMLMLDVDAKRVLFLARPVAPP